MRTTVYVEVELEPGGLMSLGEAAKAPGMSQAGVFRAIERGTLRQVIERRRPSSAGRRGWWAPVLREDGLKKNRPGVNPPGQASEAG